jgi:hypothetical protein
MRPVPDMIWCGVSAPVIQGIFVGLGVSVVGLLVFPFAFVAVRPSSGRQSNYDRTTTYVKRARRTSWAVALFAGITLIGYVILYTDASGRFCTEHFDPSMQLGVYIWTVVTGITFALLVLTAIWQGLARHFSGARD